MDWTDAVMITANVSKGEEEVRVVTVVTADSALLILLAWWSLGWGRGRNWRGRAVRVGPATGPHFRFHEKWI